ncbi:hypothetical protein CH359_18215 [Leptospira meyeri]|nr:hypothetical protein CH359_18215 [Leptospira meyeri]PJZ95177.1 hypothetical protein CH358_18180 [Leptospira meyeri]
MFNLSAYLWKFSCYLGYIFFRKNLNRIEDVQLANLRNILKNAEGTKFGEKFTIKRNWSIQEFQKQIPICEYYVYEDDLDRILKGEKNVLTKSKLRRVGLTSGSSGRVKYIPFTDLLATEFNKSISVWIYGLLSSKPKLLKGSFYFSVSPSGFPEIENEYVKIGFDVDGDYLKPWERIFADHLLVVPEWLGGIQNSDFVLYVTALRLLAAKDLTFISVWNPSFLISLLELIVNKKELLIKDLQYGRISNFENITSTKFQNQLRIHDPQRAEELGDLLEKNPQWVTVWPNLSCVSLWTDSFAENSFALLKEKLPNVNFESKGVIATEGMISIPFYSENQGPISLLAYTSHFYEFIDKNGDVHLPQNLTVGIEYEVLLTTGGGLYRYKIGDRFLITGYHFQIPILKFLGRNDDISDLVGEKIHEAFIGKELLPELKKYDLTPSNSFLRGNLQEEKAFYELVIDMKFTNNEISELTSLLETILCHNPHYEYARKIGQLNPSKVTLSLESEKRNLGRSSTTKNRFLRSPVKTKVPSSLTSESGF